MIQQVSTVAFQFQSLARFPLIHGMSGRVPGAELEGDVGHGRNTIPESIEANRSTFVSELGIDASTLTLGRQTHSANAAIVRSSDVGRGRYPLFDGFPETDALITNVVGAPLAVIVADCVPIVLYDPVQHALAVIHAGWRGTVRRIGERAVVAMQDAFGTNPNDVIAGIGPSIGPCCYEVGTEVIDAWQNAGVLGADEAVSATDGGQHLDLWTANCLVLQAAGLDAGRIESSNVCVHCDLTHYFSYRAAHQGKASGGRMLMVAQLADRTHRST